MSLYDVPDFDDLPPVEGMPQGCAWGIFDKDGQKDLLGTLNLLTPDVVAEACKEARDGVSVSLKFVCTHQLRQTVSSLLTSLLVGHSTVPRYRHRVVSR